ncbi:MAG: tetratricopeptide repeat protein [Candidatus Aenigmatarchaeota archaeon]
MKYLFIFLLSFLIFSFCEAKSFKEVTVKRETPSVSIGKGIVTTRSGKAVVTRSYTPYKKTETPKKKISKSLKFEKEISAKEKIKAEEETSLETNIRQQARFYRQEGYKLQQLGDFGGALTYYQKANQLDPRFVETYNDIGVIYEKLGDTKKALDMYKKAIEIDPNYLPAYTNLALLYEKERDVNNATYYWQKRYELGEEGEYWREVARKHLLKLGTYPKVKQDMLEKNAAILSQELIEKREREKEKIIEEINVHLQLSADLALKRDYKGALRELENALELNPPDEALKAKILERYKDIQKIYAKEQALIETEQALKYLKSEDYLSAGEKLKNALTEVFRIAQEK